MDTFKRIYRKNSAVFFSYAIAIVMFVVVSIFRPEFASAGHIKIMLIDATILGTLAVGLTFAILVGGIDLSVQWNMCASGIMVSMLYKSWGLTEGDVWWLILFCLAVTSFIGLINGIGIAYLGINPMIMTFGMNTIVQGAVVGMTSSTMPGGYAPENLERFCLGSTLGIPNLVLVWIVIISVISILLARTPFGRKIYAIGNSETVAYYSGIKTKRIKMLAFVISGLFAGIGGILFTGRIGQSYLGMGDSVMFETIAVVAIGGANMNGGSGNYIGTVGGALILTILNGLLSAFLLPAALKLIIYGAMIVISVLMASRRNRNIDSIIK